MGRRMTLKGQISLCLAAFFLALAGQIFLSFYQSGTVLRELDDQMGNFNAISRFQNGVERSLSAMEDYRWEYGDAKALTEELHSAFSVTNAWLWRIESDLGTVSEEQYLLYNAVSTTYDSYTALVDQLEEAVAAGQDTKAAQLYYNKIVPCGGYLRQYTQQLLNTAITDAQGSYTTVSALSDRVKWAQTVVVALCLALGCVMAFSVLTLLTPVQQMIGASREVTRGEFDSPDLPAPRQPEMAQLTEAFNHMKHSMAEQVTTLREKNEMERELHRQKTEALELQNRMERSRLQQLRSQIDPHFLFNTLNVILQTAGQEKAYRTQALITALSHLLRYSLMSNDEQVPLAREVRIVDEYYSIYHVRFGDRVKMVWRISDSLDLTETMVPSFILQPIVENAFKHGISPKEEGGVVRIRINPLRDKGLLYISVCDNGVGIQPEQLAQLKAALEEAGATVIMPRTDIGNEELQSAIVRAEIFNKYDCDIIYHFDTGAEPSQTMSGPHICLTPDSGLERAAEILSADLRALAGKEGSDVREQTADVFLNHVKSPAMLIVPGYITSDQDWKLFGDEAYRNNIAVRIREFTVDYIYEYKLDGGSATGDL